MNTSIELAQAQLVEAPTSDASRIYETLGYVEAYDAVLNDDYAFVAYKETECASGDACVKIKGKGTGGATFEPAAMRNRCREAGAKGDPYFTWGFSISPSPGDPRQIEFRVHHKACAPES